MPLRCAQLAKKSHPIANRPIVSIIDKPCLLSRGIHVLGSDLDHRTYSDLVPRGWGNSGNTWSIKR
jgi:hypothetical protein